MYSRFAHDLACSVLAVVPSELATSFSLSEVTDRSATISVDAIPSDRVLSHTAGFMEVSSDTGPGLSSVPIISLLCWSCD